MANIESFNSAANQRLLQQPTANVTPLPERAILPESGNNLPEETSQPEVQQVSAEQISEVIENLSDFAQGLERDLSFSVDDNTGQTVIIVKDRQTDEIVRQIPNEDLLQLAQNLQELQEKLENSKGNLLEVRV